MQFPAVQKVEDLHHNKGVENEGKMPRIDLKLFVYRLVVVVPVDKSHSSTSNSTSYNSIIPFILGMASKGSSVQLVIILGNELLPCKYQNQQHNQLEYSLACNMLEHGARYYIFISTVGWSVQELLCWRLCCESQTC